MSAARALRHGTLAACVALLAGCAALAPPRAAAPNVYVLDALPRSGPELHPSGRLVLAVSPPRAQPGFDSAEMVYVQRPYELEHFAKNRWAEAPARMLEPLLVQALARSGGFAAVLPSPSAVPAELRLDTELVRLQQDFRTRPSRVELTLRAQLIDVRDGRVLGARRFDEVERASSDDPYGGVVAANRAVRKLLAQLAAFCVRAAHGVR